MPMVKDNVPENSNVTVLIVDDDPAQLTLMSAFVTQGGYMPETASDGNEALEKAQTCNPDLILLDVYMPGVDGIDVCRQLKANPETRHIPVISVTGNLDNDVRLSCLKAGANDFISKPVDVTELMIKIRNIVRFKEFEDIKIKNALMAETFEAVERAKREWEESMDCISSVMILTDAHGRILRCNKMLIILTGQPVAELVSRDWKEVMRRGGFSGGKDFSESCEIFHESGKWFEFFLFDNNTPYESSSVKSVIILRDITEAKRITGELLQSREMLRVKNEELDKACQNLKMTQSQIVQQEKMASIGQLAAGIAHEINNPIGFISSNLTSLDKYVRKLIYYLDLQKEVIERENPHDFLANLQENRTSLKIDFIMDDITQLISESLDGTNRVKKIVQDLKSFSHADGTETQAADINKGIESTLNIVHNEIKYKATVRKELAELPLVKCIPGQLNQVFMNLFVNAVQAIEQQGEILVKSWADKNNVFVSVSDTGCGMPDEIKKRIFEPFFTTKEIGKGTGLGLSIAYDIIKKHSGEINVESSVGKGTTFTIILPVSGTQKDCDGSGQ